MECTRNAITSVHRGRKRRYYKGKEPCEQGTKKVVEDVSQPSLRWTRIQEPRSAVLKVERKKLIATQS